MSGEALRMISDLEPIEKVIRLINNPLGHQRNQGARGLVAKEKPGIIRCYISGFPGFPL
jgi:hypothetical protein